MALVHLVCVASFVLLTTGACKPRKPGEDDLRRGRDLIASQPSAALEAFERAGKAGADPLEVKKGQAAVYESQKEFDRSLTLLREVTAQRPTDVDARVAMVRIEVLRQRFDAARAELEHTLPWQPPHVPSLLLYAALAVKPGHGKAGSEAIERLDPKTFAPLVHSAEYAFARANLAAARGDEAGKIATLATAASRKVLSPGLALGLANATRAVKRLDVAEWLLARASVESNAPKEVQETLAEIALALGHLPLAKAAIAKLPTEFKPDPKALRLLAQYHDLNNEPAERAKVLRRALEVTDAEDTADRRQLEMDIASALSRSGDPKGAVAVLEALLRRDPDFPPALLLLADLRLGQKAYDEAIALAIKLETNPSLRTEAFKIEVAAYLKKPDPAAAEAAAKRFLTSSDSSPDAILLLINLLMHHRRFEQAWREAEAGVQRHPDQGELVKAQISLTEKVKGFAKAEAVALAAARTKKPGILVELARLYDRNKRFDQALKVYRELAATEPQGFFELAQLQERMGKPEDAVGSMREWVKRDDRNAGAWLRLGMLEERAGQMEAAKGSYERTLALDPNSIPALNNLVMVLLTSAAPEATARALELARRVHSLAGHDPRVMDTLGWALVRNRAEADRAEAVQLLKRSAGALRSPESDYHYGAALAAAGDFSEALSALDRSLKENANVPWREDAMRLKREVSLQISKTASSKVK